MSGPAEAAVAAYEAHEWQAVLDVLQDDARPDGDALVIRGDALYWLGNYDGSVETLEKAFSQYLEEDRPDDAARVACVLGYLGFRRQAFAVGGGWLARAERLLEGRPPTVAHVWLGLLNVASSVFGEGDVEKGLELVDQALELATTMGTKSAESLAMSFKAAGMVRAGRWKEAMGIVDEATLMAMTAGDDLRMTSDVYCNTISLCRNLGDYRRAGEWTEQAERWMKANSVSGYTGACAVHRAELKRFRGEWRDAEDEARRACAGLEQFHLSDYVGLARYEIGEIRRRMGDLDTAQREFELAYEYGHDAQPGLSLLKADRGDLDAAFAEISRSLERVKRDPDHPAYAATSRARLLPAFIEIAHRSGHEAEAVSALSDLEEIAGIYDSQIWKAAAANASGELLMQGGELEGAINALRGAWRGWLEADLPYEAARARALLGEARRLAGDETGATLELKSALSVLKELGARTEADRVAGLLGEDPAAGTAESRVTRAFVFTDIETSTDLVELIGDEAWHDLLRWHDRTLRAAIGAKGGEEVAHTGDGFFAAFGDARGAIDAAVDIQRRLLRHRREAGFAPKVRIGIHLAEATRQDGNYHGAGVHVAARVCAAASGEQILISSEVLAEAGNIPYPVSPPVQMDLKGVSGPVAVAEIEWRS